MYYVTIAFTMTERGDQLLHDNELANSTALVHAFLAKHYITEVCQPPQQPIFGSQPLLALNKF
jgi:hypothetical protein